MMNYMRTPPLRGKSNIDLTLDQSLEELPSEDLCSLVHDLVRENRKFSRQIDRLQERVKRVELFESFVETVETVHNVEKHKMEKYMRLMLENSRNVVLFLDRNGRLVYCTDIFLKLFDIHAKDAVNGRTLEEIHSRFTDEKLTRTIVNAFQAAKRSLTPTSADIKVETVNDAGKWELRFYTVTLTPFLETNGEFGGVIMLYHDITDIHARILAEDANAAKDQFIANISHEIRTPLNTILGLSELELQKKLSDDTNDNLEKIYSAGRILLGIINDVLDVSKIKAGKFKLSEENYGFLDMLSETINLNIVYMASKPIVFTFDVDERIPARLYGDEMRVKQILNNLISNAFKFTEKGAVSLWVSCDLREGEAWITFVVGDTGRGIRAEDMNELFKNYSQLEARLNHKAEGSGLGLAICKSLVEMMDGSIEVESEYGKGTVFTAKIRQGVTDETPVGAEDVRALKEFRYTKTTREKVYAANVYIPDGKVLVVDDISTNLDVAKGLLARYGMTIHCASSGMEALAMVRCGGDPYDLIFMDHMMPDMDGMETITAIRSEGGAYAKTPIVMLTANAVSGRREMFLASGVDDFIAKPINLLKLDRLLKKWMPAQKQLEPPAVPADAEDGGESAENSIPDIPGVDVGLGLAHSGGSAALYRDVLASFRRDADEKAEAIERSAAAGELRLYITLVHGIKGAAAGIGANDLAAFAKRLENAGEAGDTATVSAKTGEFLSDLRAVSRDIQAALAHISPTCPERKDFIALRPEVLKDALRDMDIQAVNALLAEYAEMPLDAETKDSVAAIERHILMFEYDEAIEAIDALL
jgi:signal transduction histidine kinase/DNA-binding NarL/FixJ family response regulator/HPt (histidine-containing phosphotransfer) domain-containing protein